jgi:hypothetical protein
MNGAHESARTHARREASNESSVSKTTGFTARIIKILPRRRRMWLRLALITGRHGHRLGAGGFVVAVGKFARA